MQLRGITVLHRALSKLLMRGIDQSLTPEVMNKHLGELQSQKNEAPVVWRQERVCVKMPTTDQKSDSRHGPNYLRTCYLSRNVALSNEAAGVSSPAEARSLEVSVCPLLSRRRQEPVTKRIGRVLTQPSFAFGSNLLQISREIFQRVIVFCRNLVMSLCQ
jgi:hypothetical protein